MAVPQDAKTIAHAKDKPMKQIDANRILNTMRMDGDRVGILQFSYELAPNLQRLGGRVAMTVTMTVNVLNALMTALISSLRVHFKVSRHSLESQGIPLRAKVFLKRMP